MKSKLKLAYERPAERVFGSPQFIARTRNIELAPPKRFEPTRKADGDVVI